MSVNDKWEDAASKFSNDLYLFLFTQRHMESYLPQSMKEYSKASHYQDSIGKAVLYAWHVCRDHHRLLLSKFHLENAKSDQAFFALLLSCCRFKEERKNEDICRFIFDMSGLLFEAFVYLLDKKHTSFIPHICTAWIWMFRYYYKDRFFAGGGWDKLKKESRKYSIQYELTAAFYAQDYLFTKKDIQSFFDPDRSDPFRDFILDLPKLNDKLQHFIFKLKDRCQCRLHVDTEISTNQMQNKDQQPQDTVKNSEQYGDGISLAHTPACVTAGESDKTEYSKIMEEIREIRQRTDTVAVHAAEKLNQQTSPNVASMVPVSRDAQMTDLSSPEIQSLFMLFFELLGKLTKINHLHASLDSLSLEENLVEQSPAKKDFVETKSEISDNPFSVLKPKVARFLSRELNIQASSTFEKS